MQKNKKFDIKITASLSKLDTEAIDKDRLYADMQSILSVAEEICAHSSKKEHSRGEPIPLQDLREDKTHSSPSREEMLGCAKTTNGGYVTLPTATVRSGEETEALNEKRK